MLGSPGVSTRPVPGERFATTAGGVASRVPTGPCAQTAEKVPPNARYSTQHSALSTQHSALSTQYSALSTQHSALSTQHSALSTQHSDSALSTQHSALSTQHSALYVAMSQRHFAAITACGALARQPARSSSNDVAHEAAHYPWPTLAQEILRAVQIDVSLRQSVRATTQRPRPVLV